MSQYQIMVIVLKSIKILIDIVNTIKNNRLGKRL